MKRLLFVGFGLVALAAWAAPATSIDQGNRRINGNLTVQGLSNFAVVDAGYLAGGGGCRFTGGIGTCPVLDAGYLVSGHAAVTTASVTGTLGVGGVTTLASLDAGEDSKIGGVTIVTGNSFDGGTTTPKIEFGYGALSSDEKAITFRSAFTSNPSCTCAHIGTTNTNACVIKTGTAPSTTGVTFTVASGGTDVINYICIGDQ